MLELSLASISIIISVFTLTIIFTQFRIDRPRLEFSYDIMCNSDRSKEWIRIYLINTGRRPLFIKSVGFFYWSLGMYVSGENKDVEKIINEAEMLYVDEPIKSEDQWEIGRIFAIDHTGKRWVTTKKQMRFLYDSAHYDGVKKEYSEKLKKDLDKMKKKSHKEYIKTINKIGRKPKIIKNET
ncbi:MAG TPA: hypothetical protein ENH35_04315 [Candidatus Moranbacteria bacterium]|nr:hypothetical protein [Candidatus Moranbacteria bacterium]